MACQDRDCRLLKTTTATAVDSHLWVISNHHIPVKDMTLTRTTTMEETVPVSDIRRKWPGRLGIQRGSGTTMIGMMVGISMQTSPPVMNSQYQVAGMATKGSSMKDGLRI
jgi:hypothetical protein